MEHEQRFERIEAALETMAKGLANLTSDSHNALMSLNASQQNQMEQLLRNVTRVNKTETDVDALFKSNEVMGGAVKDLIASQVLLVGEMTKLVAAQLKTDESIGKLAEAAAAHREETDDLDDKLHLLYKIVATWIREHGSGHHNGEAKTDPPTP